MYNENGTDIIELSDIKDLSAEYFRPTEDNYFSVVYGDNKYTIGFFVEKNEKGEYGELELGDDSDTPSDELGEYIIENIENIFLDKEYYCFKDEVELEDEVIAGNVSIGDLDYVKVGGNVFTMDNIDLSGKELSWGNKKTEKVLIMETENRYEEHGTDDAKFYLDDAVGFRNDISYAE